VTVVTQGADIALLDTSVIVNFADGAALYQLSTYLGPKAAITLDVERELTRLAGTSRSELVALERLGWPPGDALALPPDLLADAEDLRRLNAKPGDHAQANLGEISVALLAPRLNNAVVVMDDNFGKKLCRMRGVPRMSSAQLSAEMVATGDLDTDTGFAVFDVSTPDRAGRPEFDEAVSAATAALAQVG
jgi:hypothetical protein